MTDALSPEVMKLAREMREGLEGVTRGPWSPSMGGYQILTGDSWNTICVFHSGAGEKWKDHRNAAWEDGRGSTGPEANAFHVARCSPDNIRILLDALEAQEADRVSCQARVEELERALESHAALLETIAEDAEEDDVATWALASVMAADGRTILRKPARSTLEGE